MELGTIVISTLTAGLVTFAVNWLLTHRIDRRAALRERYDRQQAALQRLDELMVDAYHGPMLEEDRLRRRKAILGYRHEVLFAFGDEELANKVMGSLFGYEHHNVAVLRSTHDNVPFGRGAELRELEKRFTGCEGVMLASLREHERKLGYPETRLSKQTLRLLERVSDDATKGAPPTREAPPAELGAADGDESDDGEDDAEPGRDDR